MLFSFHASLSDRSPQPWRIKYKREDATRIYTATLYNRNSELEVAEKGIYEIVAVGKPLDFFLLPVVDCWAGF